MNNNFLCIIMYNETKFKKIKNWNFKWTIIYIQILINVKKNYIEININNHIQTI